MLGGLNLLVGLYSLWGSLRYRAYVRKKTDSAAAARRPSVSLIIPCCGREDGLEENLLALARQDYPHLRLVFVVETFSDPAVPVIERVRENAPCPAIQVEAGPARGRGQKVQNLLAALSEVGESEVLAFADSDGRPDPGWLGRLTAGLEPPGVGVASGYRFYLPEGSFASLLRSVWNAGVLTLLGEHDRNFAWGGSMAIRREVFEKAAVKEAWQGALSDDFALTHAVRRAGLRVAFVSSCLVGSEGKAGLAEVMDWCARQMAITRVYWPNLWRVAGASQILYWSFLLLGGVAAGRGDFVSLALVSALLTLSFASGGLRSSAVGELEPRFRERLRPFLWAYALFTPLASLLSVYGFVRSALSRRIEWRGKLYEMRSPTETVVLAP